MIWPYVTWRQNFYTMWNWCIISYTKYSGAVRRGLLYTLKNWQVCPKTPSPTRAKVNDGIMPVFFFGALDNISTIYLHTYALHLCEHGLTRRCSVGMQYAESKYRMPLVPPICRQHLIGTHQNSRYPRRVEVSSRTRFTGGGGPLLTCQSGIARLEGTNGGLQSINIYSNLLAAEYRAVLFRTCSLALALLPW